MQKFSPISPDDIAPMSRDFSDFIAAYDPADTIASVTMSASPATLSLTQVDSDGKVVTFVARDGAVGKYVLTFHLTMASGAAWSRQVAIEVKAAL